MRPLKPRRPRPAAGPFRPARYIVAYIRFDVAGLLALLHPEVAFRNLSGGGVDATASGVEQFGRMAQASKALFSSRRQEVVDFGVQGDTAVADIRYEGVLAADLPNGMRKGETLRLEGRSGFGFRGGGLVRTADRPGRAHGTLGG